MDLTTHLPSTAERLDDAIEQVLTGASAVSADPELQPLLETATALGNALPPIPASDAFVDRLGARLSGANPVRRAAGAIGEMTRRELRRPSRLLITGAVSSAALGVGVTAFAVWRGRSTRRPAHR